MEQIGFKLKMLKTLYGMGMKGYGPVLVAELPKKSQEWLDFISEIFAEQEDMDSRQAALRILVGRSFIERHPARKRLVQLMVDMLTDGIGSERREVVGFISKNLELFPKGNEQLQMKLMVLQREVGDPTLANMAEDVLQGLGFDMRDPDLYRQAR